MHDAKWSQIIKCKEISKIYTIRVLVSGIYNKNEKRKIISNSFALQAIVYEWKIAQFPYHELMNMIRFIALFYFSHSLNGSFEEAKKKYTHRT